MIIFTFFFSFSPLLSRRAEKNLKGSNGKNEVPKEDFFMLQSDFSLIKSKTGKHIFETWVSAGTLLCLLRCDSGIRVRCERCGQIEESGYMVDVTSPVRAGA